MSAIWTGGRWLKTEKSEYKGDPSIVDAINSKLSDTTTVGWHRPPLPRLGLASKSRDYRCNRIKVINNLSVAFICGEKVLPRFCEVWTEQSYRISRVTTPAALCCSTELCLPHPKPTRTRTGRRLAARTAIGSRVKLSPPPPSPSNELCCEWKLSQQRWQPQPRQSRRQVLMEAVSRQKACSQVEGGLAKCSSGTGTKMAQSSTLKLLSQITYTSQHKVGTISHMMQTPSWSRLNGTTWTSPLRVKWIYLLSGCPLFELFTLDKTDKQSMARPRESRTCHACH